MKLFNIITAVNLAYQAVQAEELFDISEIVKDLTKTVSTSRAPSGAIVEITSWNDHSERIITFPKTKFTDDFQ